MAASVGLALVAQEAWLVNMDANHIISVVDRRPPTDASPSASFAPLKLYAGAVSVGARRPKKV